VRELHLPILKELKRVVTDTRCLNVLEIMNKYKVYIRKRKHINFVRDYVCELHNTIFYNALHGELSPVKVELFKKYSKYLKLLEF
jgi:hypothetical protein